MGQLAFGLAVAFVLLAAIQGVATDVTIIRVVSVPDSLSAKGMTAEYVAQSIVDEIHFIRADARDLEGVSSDPLTAAAQQIAPLYGTIATDPRPELRISDAGPSLRQAVEFVRRMLGRDSPTLTLRISEQGNQLLLNYSVTHDGVVEGPYALTAPDLIAGTGISEPPLRVVAINLMTPSEPRTVGVWMAYTGRFAQVLTLLSRLPSAQKQEIGAELLEIANIIRVARGHTSAEKAHLDVQAAFRELKPSGTDEKVALQQRLCGLMQAELDSTDTENAQAVAKAFLAREECFGPDSNLEYPGLFRRYVELRASTSGPGWQEAFPDILESSTDRLHIALAAYFRGLLMEDGWMEEFEKAIEEGMDGALVHHAWAGRLYDEDRPTEGLSHAQVALSLSEGFNPSIASTYALILGDAISENAAYEYLQHTTASHRYWQDGLNELGLTAEKLELLDEADTAYRAAIAANPGDDWVHVWYGQFLGRRKHREASDRQFDLAVRIAPEKLKPYSEWGRSLHQQGHYASAAEKHLSAYNQDPESGFDGLIAVADRCRFFGGRHFAEMRGRIVADGEDFGRLFLLVGACLSMEVTGKEEELAWTFYRKGITKLGEAGVMEAARLWTQTHPDVRGTEAYAWSLLSGLRGGPRHPDFYETWTKIPGCRSECVTELLSALLAVGIDLP